MGKRGWRRGLGVVVTGASSGIGELLALRMARDGARLVLVARRADALESVAARIRAEGGEAHVLSCDVADRAAAEATAVRAREILGGVDVLVNNAGYGRHRPFLDWDVADMEQMLRVNYLGALYWTKALLPAMVEAGRGWIVFMASVAGKIATPDESAYAATKFALVGLAEALSIEVEDAGVHVLTVCPGSVRTPFFDAEALARMPPVARRGMIEPERVVDATLAALAAGRYEITVPARISAGYIVRVLAPGFMRRSVKRVTLGAIRGRSGSRSR